ncbi:hypothetical protein CDAR_452431 [Caerostris darwini]|uniref:Uncharacterized protein n=1 Tax=Caerostris darwini TaxID=1538125 RepID=A0AAV4VQ27_9ARAC|nr:hypothetical protein CDAR_452431 [Caerostris darwini]
MAFSFPPAEHHANVVCRINEASGKTQKERGVVVGGASWQMGSWKGTRKKKKRKGRNRRKKKNCTSGEKTPAVNLSVSIHPQIWFSISKLSSDTARKEFDRKSVRYSYFMYRMLILFAGFCISQNRKKDGYIAWKRGVSRACHRVFPWLRVNSRDQEDTLGRSSIPPFPLTTLWPGITKSQGKLQLVSKYKQEYLYRGLCVKTPMGWWEGEKDN